jgi:hypothetical protein
VLTQFVSPDEGHDVLKTCRELKINKNKKQKNKYIVKNRASRWLFTKNVMHVRRNDGEGSLVIHDLTLCQGN